MSNYTTHYGYYLPALGDGKKNSKIWGSQVASNFTSIDAHIYALTQELATAGKTNYDLNTSIPGYPAEGQNCLTVVASRAFNILASGHHIAAGTLPTAAATFTVLKNGTSIGTLTLGTTGAVTLTGWSATSFAVGDVLTITAPTTLDLTLQNVGITLLGSC